MEGGVALFLLFVLVVIAAGLAIAFYVTGGALLVKSQTEKEEVEEERPTHEAPTSPTQEKVTFAGTEQDQSRAERE